MQIFALLPFLACSIASTAAQPRSFTVLSEPIRLRYGEVYNHMQNLLKLPEDVVARYAGDTAMAVVGYKVDVVKFDAEGQESQVLLSSHYLHHFILHLGQQTGLSKMQHAIEHNHTWAHKLTGCHAMTRKGMTAFFNELPAKEGGGHLSVFGSGEGAEYRHTDWRMEAPFAKVIRNPQVWAPLVHLINTNNPHGEQPYSPLLECPCTPQRKIDLANGTIDGQHPMPPIHCSPEFAATGNPSCHLSTYKGGWRCCENHVFLIDTAKECASLDCLEEPVDEVFLKVIFMYEDATKDTRNIEPSACCDVTGNGMQGAENVEYDVPQCPAGTAPEDCVHVAEAVQPAGYFGGPHFSEHKPSDLVDLVFAQPHLHVAGISLELIDDVTKETICEVHRTEDGSGGILYGTGSEPGNEKDYLVGLTTCAWAGGTAPRFRRDHALRIRAVYDATVGHTGVMSLWLMDVAPVYDAASPDPDLLV